MNSTDLQNEIARLGKLSPWYHCVQLPDGSMTPGWSAISNIWDSIRHVRSGIDYVGKRVLDLGSRDGMWAFEAEQLGAKTVVATDIGDDGYREHILFLKQILRSSVAPFYNVPSQDVVRRLDYFMEQNPGPFDIVQHLGLFYHLEDPLISLKQCHKIMAPGGVLLFETAIYRHGQYPVALFNSRSNIYNDKTTFWAFNARALYDALEMYGFKLEGDPVEFAQSEDISRICLKALRV